ncbi:thioredoxin-disulfide reductase [Hansschlegelia quercus]|uniref:Thioredoxin reductase n=1 Tax=Hansschlegelia quercus TaxID=2528245 RepID=A0A4Q9GKE2_9HYPH|nr:thioredoxin-disulfide reductase [Hansschlegelia quercus]TBN54829.1 thioredoxin-disulfide reductase [Hansschlegelia quercus]
MSIEPNHVRLAIIGSGPAGWTAAVYAARAMLEPVVISGLQPGGQLTITTDVENYPGFADPIQGPWLMEQMQLQAERMGSRTISDHVSKVDLSRRPFVIETESSGRITADAIIVSTGAQARWLGLESEEKFKGYGVSACATCDGFFFRNKQVVVVGGGNTALEEALFLTNFASKVTLVHRRDGFRGERILQERVYANPKIDVVWNATIGEVMGSGGSGAPLKVEGVKLVDTRTGQPTVLPCDGVFIAIGHAPATELFRGQLDMKPSGYLSVKPGTALTNVPGVFAAGDVADEHYRQAVTAAGMGCMAALDAERYLAREEAARNAA